MSWIRNTDLRCENYDLDPDRLSAWGWIRIPVNQIFWAWPDMVQVFIDIPSFVHTLKVEIKKSNDLCQIPMYRMHWETFIDISKKKSWGMCMQLISLLIQPFKREHNFLSWKYAWQSGQANTLLFYINLLIKSIMVWHIHLSSLPM